jgi:DNA polymerase-1
VSEVSGVGRDSKTPEQGVEAVVPETECRTRVSDARVGHTLVTQAADLPMVIQAAAESSVVGLDLETTGLSPQTDRVRLLSLCCDTMDGGAFTYLVDCFAVTDFAGLWEALASVPVVGHNLLFDLPFLAKLGFEPGACRDTMLMSQVLHAGDGSQKHSLAACCRRELGVEVDKSLQASDWAGALTPEQLRYAAADTELVRRLHDALVPKLRDAGLAEAAAIENRALPAVAWMSASGVAFDQPAWNRLADEAKAEADRLVAELDTITPPRPGEMFGSGWKWDSNQSVAKALKVLGFEVEGTDDITLSAIDHPIAPLLRDYRAARKRVTTYGPEWLKDAFHGGRVYAKWLQCGSRAGRMACSGPNLQNLPRDPRYRCCVVAPPGRVLVKADYSQIELRIAAKIANETNMIEAYRQNEDLHTRTARLVLGKQDVTKADRQLAKALTFGLLYGMGADKLREYARTSYGVELTGAEAKRHRSTFFATYPRLKRWHGQVGATKDGAVETRTLAGRRRQNVISFMEKLNSPVQGTGADGLKAALGLLWERRAECPGAVPVLAVHDEVVVECDADRADAVAAWLKAAMVDGMAPLIEPVPVEVAVSMSPSWGG